MNFHKAKILLDKINRLYKGMADDSDNMNPIERDLMLNYLRELYEAFYWEKNQETSSTTKVKTTPPKPEPIVVHTPPPPKPEPVVIHTPPPPKPEPVVVNTPPKPPKPEPVVVHTPPPPKPEPVVVEKKEPVKFEFKVPQPRNTPEPKPVESNDSSVLFESKTARDLSDKLGLAPIKDLNRAFGLNDKLMYTNNLFGGDNNVYKQTMETLNSLNSFDEAKQYLIKNIAGKYNWTSKKNEKQAKDFIRTISRRYI